MDENKKRELVEFLERIANMPEHTFYWEHSEYPASKCKINCVACQLIAEARMWATWVNHHV